MNRFLAFLAALILSAVAIAAAGTASPGTALHFELDPASDPGRVHASFRKDGHDTHDWSTDLRVEELAGLDREALRSAGNSPVRFAVVREAGRLDCAGSGGNRRASGTCAFNPDAGFLSLLDSRGIRRPTSDEALAMMAIDVRRAIVEALASARYPTPTPEQLIALTAVRVDGSYVAGLARAGYRPDTLGTLLQFRAIGVTPDYIEGLVRAGYARIPPDGLVQLKALNVDAGFISGFEQLGYGRLPVSSLVQLKALGITPEFARSVRGERGTLPSVDELVTLRLGFRSGRR